MREKKIFVTLATAMLFSMMLFALSGIKEAHAQTTEPLIYVDTAASRTTTPLLTPPIVPRKTFTPPAVATFNLYIRCARFPHLTHEPVQDTDKTWSWQVRLTWDPTYFKIALPSGADVAAGSFLNRRMYYWTDPDETPESGDEYWSCLDPNSIPITYPTTGIKCGYEDIGPGTALLFNGLSGFDANLMPLPAEYFDAYAGAYAPDKGRHEGTNYDLPYTENLTQAVTQPDLTSVTEPNYNTLAVIKITQFALTPDPTANPTWGTTFHLSEPIVWDYDGRTTYTPLLWDAYYQNKPIIPEFPLGLAPLLMLAPAIPIVYLWRIRKRKVR